MPRKLKANLIDGQIQTQNLALDNLLDNDNQIKTLLIQNVGQGYTDGKYFNVCLHSIDQQSCNVVEPATVDFIVKNGYISKVILKKQGKGYVIGQLLTATNFSTGTGLILKVSSITNKLNKDAMKSERVAVGTEYAVAPLHVAGNALSSQPSSVQSTEMTGAPTIADVMFSARADEPYEIFDNSNHYGYESIITFNNKNGSTTSNIAGFRSIVSAKETNENSSAKIYAIFGGAFRNHFNDKSLLTTNALFGNAIYYGHNTTDLSTDTLTNDAFGSLIQGYSSSGKITNCFGQSIRLFFSNNSSITNYIALHLARPSQGVGSPRITNRWGIFQEDTTSRNYFAGNVGVGLTSPTKARIEVSGGVSYKPSPSLSFRFINGSSSTIGSSNTTNSTATYSIWVSNAIGASEFHAFSDERLKNINHKITPEFAYEFINKVNAYSYSLKADKNKDEKFGFIAQDLIKAGFGNLVGSYEDINAKELIDQDGFKSPSKISLTVNYEQVIPILMTAIKDLKEQVEELKINLKNHSYSK
jgi:hypothetical protein